MKNFILILLLAVGFTACQKDYYLDDLREAEQTIEGLEGQIAQLTSELSTSNANNLQLTNDLAAAHQTIGDLTDALTNLSNEYADLQEVALDLGLTIEELLAIIEELQSRLIDANNRITEL